MSSEDNFREKLKGMKLVVVESPYSGDVSRNIRYARLCVKDCIRRGEAPIASHLLFTQDGILDDNIPSERAAGMNAGFAWNRHADLVVVYSDFGVTLGMEMGIQVASMLNKPIVFRKLPLDLMAQIDKTQ